MNETNPIHEHENQEVRPTPKPMRTVTIRTISNQQRHLNTTIQSPNLQRTDHQGLLQGSTSLILRRE